MFKVFKKEIDFGEKKITLETGKVARQADGAIIATCGETVVLATAVGAKKVNPDVDYFPLSVNYQEKYYAAGKIPGGYFKREARPTESETLISRLIDRPIRPLFPEQFLNEVQIICQVLNYDLVNSPDIPAMIGASAALTISGIPFLGPLGASKVGQIDGKFILNPSNDELLKSDLELTVAGTKNGVLMVESEAKELSEEKMLDAVVFGQKSFLDVINLIVELAEDVAKAPWDLKERDIKEELNLIEEEFSNDLEKTYLIQDKSKRQKSLGDLKGKLEELSEKKQLSLFYLSKAFSKFQKNMVRKKLLSSKNRIDGRKIDEVRKIDCEVGLLPRSHGSALFTRGETQAIVTLTLGTTDDEQMMDTLDGLIRERFMLHYNFPPFSVGEAGRMGGVGRREIGHGKLAWRALRPVLPEKDEFPYTFRIVSEITESNGSSSMASVCGGSLSLMDAGVPIKRQVAGIAMGLIKEKDDYLVLSDILGDEDHLGDMDFKVAGTKEGITSLQMDIKIDSITTEIMKVALKQANKGRIKILKEMDKEIKKPNSNLNKYAPKMEMLNIKTDKIREVIGSGGKVIREIVEKSGAKVDIDDSGMIKVSSSEQDNITKALQMIHEIIDEPEDGKIYEGKVVKIVEFGAFVNFLGKKDGLVHISALKEERVGNVSDVLNEGEKVKVKVIGFDKRGKVRLSMKEVDQKTGKPL